MDILSELGELAFASRLRRLSDMLMQDVSQVYHRLDLDFQARWFPVLYALCNHGPITVTGLAHSLRLTHPAINQITTVMEKKGLIKSKSADDDDRKRLLVITEYGLELESVLKPVWKEIQSLTKELIQASDLDLMKGLTSIEKDLETCNMGERLWRRLRPFDPESIVITEYNSKDCPFFAEICLRMCRKYLNIELIHKHLSSLPVTILKNKGYIYLAKQGMTNVGLSSLTIHQGEIYELTILMVDRDYQHSGLGHKLVQKVIDQARRNGAKVLYLRTDAFFKKANKLFRSYSFRKARKSPFSIDATHRATITMRLTLSSR